MTEFLTEYGMFLAKAVTLVVAFLFVIGGVATAAARNRHSPDEGTLRVRHLNREMEALKDGLREEIVPEAQRKQHHKARKKEEKARKKAEKGGADKRPTVYVLDFDGDIRASAVANLRREISAVLQVAAADDEVVVRLESPGGMVHSYGLAASQLRRIREHDIALTVCVDQVAASGGYMMACIANRILAAPFAVMGSIGVVAQIPNLHRLLKKNDVDVELMTAGEYKRTLTVLGENTDKAREKFQQELEETHQLFKQFVADNRADLDIQAVATGESWFGTRALELGLVDEIATSDEYLLKRSKDAEVFEVHWEYRQRLAERLGIAAEGSLLRVAERLWQRFATRWMH